MADFSNVQMSLQRGAGAIQNNKYISAITNGLMSAMPITIVGALGSLVNSFPVQGYQDFLVNDRIESDYGNSFRNHDKPFGHLCCLFDRCQVCGVL